MKKCYINWLLVFIIIIDVVLKYKIVFFSFFYDERGIIWYLENNVFLSYAQIWFHPLKYLLNILFPLFGANTFSYGITVIISSIFAILSIYLFIKELTLSAVVGVIGAFFYVIYGAGLGYTPYIIHLILLNFSYSFVMISLYYLIKLNRNIMNYTFSVICGGIAILFAPPRVLYFSPIFFLLSLYVLLKNERLSAKYILIYAMKIIVTCFMFIYLNAYLLGIEPSKVAYKGGNNIRNIVDGVITDDNENDYWIDLSSESNYWIEIDLGRIYNIDKVIVYNTKKKKSYDRGLAEFRIGISKNKTKYKTLSCKRMYPRDKECIKKIDVKNSARYLRIYVDSFYGHSAGLNEVKVFVRDGHKVINVAYKKPISLSFLGYGILLKKLKEYVVNVLCLGVLKPDFWGLVLIIFSFIGLLGMFFKGSEEAFLVGLGGMLICFYFLILRLYGLGADYSVQSRNLAPCVLGYSLFWAGIISFCYKKSTIWFYKTWMNIILIIIFSVGIVVISWGNIRNQNTIINRYYNASKTCSKLRKSIAEHFKKSNLPMIMYFQYDANNETFYDCFNGGLWGYAIGLGADFPCHPEMVRYVTEKNEIINYFKNGWGGLGGKQIKPASIENIYGLRIEGDNFTDITLDIRSEVGGMLNI